MNRRLLSLLVALVALVGAWSCGVYSNRTWQKRSMQRWLAASVSSFDRYVDIGVELRVVAADPQGEMQLDGVEQRMRVLRIHRAGGLLDTATHELVGPSRAPRLWYCSEDQEPVILHPDDALPGQLVYGSEGSGKSTAIAMWLYFRWLELLGEGREIGCCAPVRKRLKVVRVEAFKLWGPTWFRYRKSEDLVVFADGTRVQFVSTKKQSKAGGSPVQMYNWSAAAQDELQDQDDEAHDDIGQRCRSAKNGRPKRIASCTAKPTSAFRTRRARMLASGAWLKRVMLVAKSPFISPAFIEQRKRELSDREFRRRFGAEDLTPQLAEYPSWSRDRNLIKFTPGEWEDVTGYELARWTPRGAEEFDYLAGHDPGALCDVTLFLKALRRYRTVVVNGTVEKYAETVWIVVGEETTDFTTTQQHLDKLKKLPWLANKRVLVRCDPYGGNDNKPDRTVYTQFRNAGYTILPAAFSVADPTKPGRVPKNEGIEVINMLLWNAMHETRLYVAIDKHGVPVAPRLVQSFEEAERDEKGRAEMQRKNESDLSHWTAAIRYALWVLERPRLHERQDERRAA